MNAESFILWFILFAASALLLFKLASLLVISRKKRQSIPLKEIIAGRIEIGPADLCYPVRYASEQHFGNPLTFLPWNGLGALIISDSEFLYYGKDSSGDLHELRFKRDDCLVAYVPKTKLRDSGLSWFYLESEDATKHYFCTKIAIPNLTTEFGTTALYEKITERFSNL